MSAPTRRDRDRALMLKRYDALPAWLQRQARGYVRAFALSERRRAAARTRRARA